ncbi:Hypothetical protein A7982_01299 [Minicystis rosea]|nr:Hypothetical protein A7982_01299 [Minicystis rosea]
MFDHHVPAGPLLRRPDDIDDPRLQTEAALRVDGARIVYADHDLLQHDFPELREAALARRHPDLALRSGADRVARVRALIERWLLDHAAIITPVHVRGTEVNTPVAVRDPVIAYRPQRYGRALVVEAGSGLLDIKGVGVEPGQKPTRAIHENGLCELGEVLRDLVMQRIFDEVLRRAAPEIYTVPTYALIDLGFDVRLRDDLRTPAACQVRRAHRRPVDAAEIPRSDAPEALAKAHVEVVLRSYGLTSACSVTRFHIRDDEGRLDVRYAKTPLGRLTEAEQRAVRRSVPVGPEPIEVDAINVQLTREVHVRPVRAQIVDLGHYRFLTDVERPLVNLVRDKPLRWGALCCLRTHDICARCPPSEFTSPILRSKKTKHVTCRTYRVSSASTISRSCSPSACDAVASIRSRCAPRSSSESRG